MNATHIRYGNVGNKSMQNVYNDIKVISSQVKLLMKSDIPRILKHFASHVYKYARTYVVTHDSYLKTYFF